MCLCVCVVVGGEGGGRYLLLATMGSMRADADFPQGQIHQLEVPTAEPQAGLAGTHTGTRRQPARRVSPFMFALCGG